MGKNSVIILVGLTLAFLSTLKLRAFGDLSDRPSFKVLVVSQKDDSFKQTIEFAMNDLKTVRGKLEILPYEYAGHFDSNKFAKWANSNLEGVDGALLSLRQTEASLVISQLLDKKLPDLSFWIFPYVNALDGIGKKIPSSVYFLDTPVENFLSLVSAQIQKPLSCRTTRYRFSLPSTESVLEAKIAEMLELDRVNEGSRGCGTRYYRETSQSPSVLGRKSDRVKGNYDCVIAYGDRNELRSCVMAEMQMGRAAKSLRFVYASAEPYSGEAPTLPDDFLKTGNHWAAGMIELKAESDAKDLEKRFHSSSKARTHLAFGKKELLALEAASIADTLVDQKRRGKSLELKSFASPLGELKWTSKSAFPFRPFFLVGLQPVQNSQNGNSDQIANFNPDLSFSSSFEN